MNSLDWVLEEDEENLDESRSFVSHGLSPISNSGSSETTNTQLVFLYTVSSLNLFIPA